MGAFWADAENLFETARQASLSGSPDGDWAILIGPRGHVRMLDAAGWTLASLLAQHGADTAYRITRERGRVCLEGRRGSQTCLLRSEPPAAALHLLGGHYVPPAAWCLSGPAWLALAAPAPPTEELCKTYA